MTDVSLTDYTDRTGDRRWRVVAQTLKHGNAPKTISACTEGYRRNADLERSKVLTLEALLDDLGDEAHELVTTWLDRHERTSHGDFAAAAAADAPGEGRNSSRPGSD